jgi:hypothetical protein
VLVVVTPPPKMLGAEATGCAAPNPVLFLKLKQD